MVKRLAILAGSTLIVAVMLMARYDQNYDAGKEGYNVECVQSSQPTAASASLACKIYPGQNAEQGKSSPPWWHKLLAWPEGITAWLLMFTLGAIIWQAWETRNAVEAGRNAAEAALINAKALINSERPWILVTTIDKPDFLGNHDVLAVNRGRTPAAIVSIEKNCVLAEGEEALPKLPVFEEKLAFTEPVILLPEETYRLYGIAALLAEFSSASPEQFAKFEEGEIEAYAFGKVLYRDLLSPPTDPLHETSWCYMFIPATEEDVYIEPRRPDGYVKHT
jgi:hypothetical protein